MFELDPNLERDSIPLAAWPLSELRLMNDSQYPWLILVPRIENVTELYQLDQSQRDVFNRESNILGQTLMSLYSGDKLNVAALGNVVSQLHIHHIVRFRNDPAWPAPIWGKLPVREYKADDLAACQKRLSPLINPRW